MRPRARSIAKFAPLSTACWGSFFVFAASYLLASGKTWAENLRMIFSRPGWRGRSYPAYVAIFFFGAVVLLAAEGLWAAFHSCHGNYDMVNPDFICLDSHDNYRTQDDYEPLRQVLLKKIDSIKEEKNITRISVYFRDLKNGPRFGIQEFDSFNGASLLKLPVMIAILRMADARPDFLDERIVTPPQLSDRGNVEESAETLLPDTSYTIRELLRKMIIYSDNQSAFLLADAINTTPQPLKSNTFLDLGVMDLMSGKISQLSMQSYSTLFVTLYNSRYLSNAMSQYALELLSRSTFHDGLVAGVPPGTRVAHKFGFNFDKNTGSELHDCGIVYYLPTPYILCVMTSGRTGVEDEAAIAGISRTVYDTVEQLHEQLDR